ncbi:MAG: glycosyltransferase family 1 protein [Actinobacteria bacterium]|nr:MAG: glycosyltransferase family 1 protein [Actinomycetota bacterium]
MEGVRVAYTLEQCWHRVPGGTAVAALEVARAMTHVRRDVELVGVSGKHLEDPALNFDLSIDVAGLRVSGALLYEMSLRFNQPRVERTMTDIDLVHCTTIIPFATRRKMVATVHDLAFLHHPEFFTRRGNDVFRRSLKVLKKRADVLLCSSQATVDDCLSEGFARDRVRLVTLGVRSEPASQDHIAQVRKKYGLPTEYLLFVGTLEPRKNLARLVSALSKRTDLPPLVIAGASGWGDIDVPQHANVQFVGFVDDHYLAALYAGASVMCYPSLWEGFGLPILEAMAQGTPVVTSIGTSTQEVAGGAAVLVDPLLEDSIGAGIDEALRTADQLRRLGRERALQATWDKTAIATAHIYDEVVGS